MSRWQKSNTVQQLTCEGWVELYVPQPSRQGYAGDADGFNEFAQGRRKFMPYHDHSWFDPDKWSKGGDNESE
jgi:hypothetical protein